jgi:integrase/recombinase XerD
VARARKLLASIGTLGVVGLRDRAFVAIPIYTASRAGAVAKLLRGSFYRAGDQSMLHFDEKGGKSREIQVRHDQEQILLEYILEYIDAAGLGKARKDTPLFRTAYRKTGGGLPKGHYMRSTSAAWSSAD